MIEKMLDQEIESSGTLALTRYSCENIPSHLLLKNDKTRPNTQIKIPEDLSLRIKY